MPPGLAALPLLLGVFQLFVVTPVSFAAGFTSVASNVTIGIADLMTALIGVALLTRPIPSPSTAGQSQLDQPNSREPAV